MQSNIPATAIRIEPEVKRDASAILDELGSLCQQRLICFSGR